MTVGSGPPFQVFYSYAPVRKDKRLCEELEKHLALLERQGIISGWHRHRIMAGTNAVQQIDIYLNTAHIILLLISPDFIASSDCCDIEMKRALERHENGEARVIFINLRLSSVNWYDPTFQNVLVLPSANKTVDNPIPYYRDKAFI